MYFKDVLPVTPAAWPDKRCKTLQTGDTSQMDKVPSREAQARSEASSFAKLRLEIASLCCTKKLNGYIGT